MKFIQTNNAVSLALFLSILAMLSGCSALNTMKRTDAQITGDSDILMKSVNDLRGTQKRASQDIVQIHKDGFWVSKKEVPLKEEISQLSCNLTVNESAIISLDELSQKITSMCGVNISIDNTPIDDGENTILPMVRVNWTGPLTGLLNNISNQSKFSWRVEDGSVILSRYDTRNFQVFALPSADDINLGLSTTEAGSSGSSSSGSESGKDNTVKVESKLRSDVLNDIENTIKAMLSPKGKISLSLSTASINVTDNALVLQRIQRYMDEQNKLLTTQVLLNVKVFNIDFNRTDQYGIDWNVLYKKAGTKISWSNSPGLSGLGNGNIGLVKGGLDASTFIHALSSQGKISILTQPSITTLNLQTAPMEVIHEQNYVSSISSSLVQGVGAQTTLNPSTVTTGFTMGLLPYVMNNNQLLLQYSIKLSDLESLTRFTAGEGPNAATVQLPEVNRRAFNQKVKINSGETLILSGFEQEHLSSNLKGIGTPENPALGGERNAGNKRSVLVIMITPVVLS
ncbi:PilN family type IVB pilus formation outer membrane protein [Salmonella enterica subsp. diarizonae serovar 47:k:z53:[z84]]|nr:PilN family type IVB pilus formation outer membrane protein [Salmonella enterica subsp. diarizonae serovar 47:k:z53:[z84]]